MSQELGPEARALLARARHSREPSVADHWAVRRSLAARLGAASAAVTAGVATTKASASLLGGIKLSLLSQFGVATVAGATLATSAMLVHSAAMSRAHTRTITVASVTSPSRSAPRLTPKSLAPTGPTESTSPSPEAMPEAEAFVPVGPTEPPMARRTNTSGARAASSQASTANEDIQVSGARDALDVTPSDGDIASTARGRLLDEGRALAQVQKALSEHRGRDALRLLDAQTQQFVDGALAPERAAARVFALCDAEKRVESRTAAERFAQTWPDSPLLGRVLATCK